MYSSYLRDTCLVEAQESAFPQLDVGVERVLHQHGDALSAEGFGKLCHSKRACRRARSDPEGIQPSSECLLHMAGGGHFGGDLHTQLTLDALEPRQAFATYPLEGARACAGLPQAGTEEADTSGTQRLGRREGLCFGLGTTRASKDYIREGRGMTEGEWAEGGGLHGRASEGLGLRLGLCAEFFDEAEHRAV